MAAKYLVQVAGAILEKLGIVTSAGAGDADKLVSTDSSGRIDSTLMPVGFGSETFTAVASEAIAAGDFVNVYSNAGTINIRKADATAPAKFANGFVLSAVASSGTGTVYYGNLNTAQTGLTIGVLHYLSATTPGKATATAPTGTGQIVQQLGTAKSGSELLVEIQQTIQLA